MAAQYDIDAYLAANPDIVQYAQSHGLDARQFGEQHYNTTGQYEIAEGLRGGAPAGSRDAYTVTNLGDGGYQFSVAPPPEAASAAPQLPEVFDIDTYLAANPDIAEYAAKIGADPRQYGREHYQETGQYEIAEGLRGGAPAGSRDDYTVTSLDDGGYQFTRIPRPEEVMPVESVVSQTASQTGGIPDFGIYSSSAGRYVMPSLQYDANGNPYYAAYTNDRDLAGRIMAAEGQRIRLVDTATGQVVYEGVGPEGAAHAAAIANAVSQDKGRKAAWSIEAEYADGWKTQGYDRYDPKKKGIWGTVLDIVAPFVLNAVLPGVGGALAGALGSVGGAAATAALANTASGLVQGESLGDALKGAAVSGLTAGALQGAANVPGLNKVTDAVNKVTTPVQTAFDKVLSPVATILSPIDQALGFSINGAGDLIDAAGNVRNDIKDVVLGRATIVPAGTAGNTVAELVVTPSALSGIGAPLSGVLGNTVEELIVNPQKKEPWVPGTPYEVEGVELSPQEPEEVIPQVPYDPAIEPPPSTGTEVSEVVVSPAPPPITVPGPVTPIPDPGVVPIDPNVVLPEYIPPTVITPGVPSPTGTTGGGTPSLAGTRASLTPIFTAQLPAATFGTRTPREGVDVDTRYAIDRPEQSFFTNIPQLGPSRFAVSSPITNLLAGIGDLNDDGVVDELDRALFRKRFGVQAYAEGGDVDDDDEAEAEIYDDDDDDDDDDDEAEVEIDDDYRKGGASFGKGDGRSDEIEARLSDGEYVIDAETVALLGNGSSKAGAKALDRFRVNVRKHKGRDLAKGRFSVDAKPPEHYLGAR